MTNRIKSIATAVAVTLTLGTCLAIACVAGHLAGCAVPVAQAPAAIASQTSNNSSTADQRVNVGNTKSLGAAPTSRPSGPKDPIAW